MPPCCSSAHILQLMYLVIEQFFPWLSPLYSMSLSKINTFCVQKKLYWRHRFSCWCMFQLLLWLWPTILSSLSSSLGLVIISTSQHLLNWQERIISLMQDRLPSSDSNVLCSLSLFKLFQVKETEKGKKKAFWHFSHLLLKGHECGNFLEYIEAWDCWIPLLPLALNRQQDISRVGLEYFWSIWKELTCRGRICWPKGCKLPLSLYLRFQDIFRTLSSVVLLVMQSLSPCFV